MKVRLCRGEARARMIAETDKQLRSSDTEAHRGRKSELKRVLAVISSLAANSLD